MSDVSKIRNFLTKKRDKFQGWAIEAVAETVGQKVGEAVRSLGIQNDTITRSLVAQGVKALNFLVMILNNLIRAVETLKTMADVVKKIVEKILE